jgi:hypothetical protein
VPGCFVNDTSFLPVGSFGGTVAAVVEGTTSETVVDADVDVGAGVRVPEGDSG